MAFNHRIGLSTVSAIINETCESIWGCLTPIYLKKPNEQMWEQKASTFLDITNFPNCVGAIDGKQVIIQAPGNSDSLYFNYKGTYSVVLLAACDATYCYTFVDIGAYGKQGDSTIFSESQLGKLLFEGGLNLPWDRCLPQGNEELSLVFVADEALQLKKNIMRPYPGKNMSQDQEAFNYRLCRARRLIENTFGITSSRWRILRKPIVSSISTVEKIVKAVVCLHNFVCQNEVNSTVCQRNATTCLVHMQTQKWMAL
ncbi:uncharacterized protein [Parasteatoda tepidariorum]|uniref:uncharacterized protein n=1 Tax=Parasteatoda tepidariorum TaxID=114398 RepID=UPI001C71AB52|nr:protein ALP1-like [Parasteatoda tepidariorum]